MYCLTFALLCTSNSNIKTVLAHNEGLHDALWFRISCRFAVADALLFSVLYFGQYACRVWSYGAVDEWLACSPGQVVSIFETR